MSQRVWPPRPKLTPWNLSVVGASCLLGLMIAALARSAATTPPFYSEYGRDRATTAIQQLEIEQRTLKEQVSSLRAQVADYQKSLISGARALDEVRASLEQQQVMAGLVAVRGPGIQVTLDDSPRPMVPGDNPAHYLIHDYDLRDVIALLWVAGAEAISINDERLVPLSSVYCVGTTCIVNATRLSPPYEIRAIGNILNLEDALRNPTNLRKLKERARLTGLQFKVSVLREMTLPAYSGGLDIRYASPSAQK